MSRKNRRKTGAARPVPAALESEVRKTAEEMVALEQLRKKESIPITPTRSYDVSAIVSLFAALGAMGMAEEPLANRLKAVKNGFRDWRSAMSGLKRSADRILASFPDEKAISLLRMKDDMGFKTFMNGRAANREPGLTVIGLDNLDVIIRAAHEYCKICDKRCDSCQLGRALDYSVPETRERGRSWSMMDVGSFTPGEGT